MPLDKSKWYLMDLEGLLVIWKLALTNNHDFEAMLENVKKKYDPKQKKGVKKMTGPKLKSRLYSINAQLKKKYNKRLPIPKASSTRRGRDWTSEDGVLAGAGLLGFLADATSEEESAE